MAKKSELRGLIDKLQTKVKKSKKRKDQLHKVIDRGLAQIEQANVRIAQLTSILEAEHREVPPAPPPPAETAKKFKLAAMG